MKALLYGLALGDALGAPTEFMSMQAIQAHYGMTGIQEPPTPTLYTDDTQMTLALVEALTTVGHRSVGELMPVVGQRFVEWAHSPENDRAPGNTCLSGIATYEEGVPWQEAGLLESKGCGSAMRVAAIGYFYQEDEARLKAVAEATSMITHRHPAALAASSGAAYLVKLALDGHSPDHYLGLLHAFTADYSEDYDRALLRVSHVLGWGDEIAAMRYIGEGWVAEEAVALALYCVLRYPDSYVKAVQRGANSNGDSDSVACIAGGVAAARLGLDAIPQAWIARCENHSYIADLSQRLASARSSVQD